MKIYISLSTLVLLSLLSCKKEESIINEHIKGTWVVDNELPANFLGGNKISYTFKENDQCEINIFYNHKGKDTTMNRTYILSDNNDTLTIFRGLYGAPPNDVEKYKVIKLTSLKMQWIELLSKDQTTIKILNKR